ncbi:MAG: DUF998 domain-containing protein [Thermoplasmata archaeon]
MHTKSREHQDFKDYIWGKFIYMGVIGPVITLLFIIVDVYLSPWFSWRGNSLSDLGVMPYGYLFNGGLILGGLLSMLFVLAIVKKVKFKPIYLVMIGAIALALVGIFNEHYAYLHLAFALIYFLFTPVGILIYSFKTKDIYKYWGFFIGISSVFDIIVGIYFHYFDLKIGLAIPEIIEAILISLWFIGGTFSNAYISSS